MKGIFIGLVGVVSMLMGSSAIADLLGERDDTYIGFQVRVPLAASLSNLKSGGTEYSALFISQQDGMRDGIVFTRDTDGNRTLGYLRPSRTYSITRSQISDYTIPMVSLNQDSEIQTSFAIEGMAGLVTVGAVLVVMTKEILDESVDCISPDKESEEIAGC